MAALSYNDEKSGSSVCKVFGVRGDLRVLEQIVGTLIIAMGRTKGQVQYVESSTTYVYMASSYLKTSDICGYWALFAQVLIYKEIIIYFSNTETDLLGEQGKKDQIPPADDNMQ